MTKFEVLCSITDIQNFSELVFDMADKADSVSAFQLLLAKELTEKELQTIMLIAQSDYPLCFESRQ